MALTQIKTGAIADDAVTGAKIADDTVAEANMANDAISLAELKAGTDGQIITWDASGNPVAVGPGTDGQVLTSTGAGSPPAFEDAAASVGGSSGVDFNDSVEARFGTGNDLRIYHDGTESFIHNNTDDLNIEGDSIKLRSHGGEAYMTCAANGAVGIRYDNSEKISTTSQGMNLEGNGSDHYLLDLHNTGSGIGSQIQFRNDHESAAYIGVRGDTSGDLRVYTEKNFKIEHGSEVGLKSAANGAVEVYHNGTKKFESHADGLHIGDGGNLDMPSDSARIVMGASDDLQIYHDGSNSYVEDSGTGSLIIRGSRISFNDASNNEWARINADGLHLGGTSSANAIDDYEEGTWTPTFVSNGGTDPSCTYGNRYGRYTKIGNVVYYSFFFDDVDIGNHGSGNAAVGGWPFAHSSDNPNSFAGVYHVTASKFSADNVVGLYVRTGESKASLIMQTGSQVAYQTNHNDYSFGSAGFYYV